MRMNWFRGIACAVSGSGIGAAPANRAGTGGVVYLFELRNRADAISIKLMHDLEYAKQLLQYAIQAQQLADAIKNTAHGGPATFDERCGGSWHARQCGPGRSGAGVFSGQPGRAFQPDLSWISTDGAWGPGARGWLVCQ
jgi:hypothetical protein